jgi:membrane-bound lytic murein transglycosylase B
MMKIAHALLLLLLALLQPAHAVTLPGISEFIDEMVEKHNFKRAELETVFERAQHIPMVIEAISRPATIRPWQEYRASFVNPERIRLGLKFWDKHRTALQNAEREFGVPQEIILAVIGVETVYGLDVGTFLTLDALTTLAFDYPRRAKFFRSELENYLLLAREQQFDLLTIRGSYAGALGIPQFMPSSYRTYAVDFNGDQRIDLLREPPDAIGSVGSYLKGYGWVSGQDIAAPAQVGGQMMKVGEIPPPRSVAAWSGAGVHAEKSVNPDGFARLADFTVDVGKEYWLVFNNFEVITRYNNSDYYAMSVYQLAQALKEARNSRLNTDVSRVK